MTTTKYTNPGHHTLRDETSGQYASGFDRLCVCGHAKGCHLAGKNGNSNGGCIQHEVSEAPGTDFRHLEPAGPHSDEFCSCEKFRPARIKKTK